MFVSADDWFQRVFGFFSIIYWIMYCLMFLTCEAINAEHQILDMLAWLQTGLEASCHVLKLDVNFGVHVPPHSNFDRRQRRN